MDYLILVLMFLLSVASTLLKAKYHWLLIIENDTMLKHYKLRDNFLQDPNYKGFTAKNYIVFVLLLPTFFLNGKSKNDYIHKLKKRITLFSVFPLVFYILIGLKYLSIL